MRTPFPPPRSRPILDKPLSDPACGHRAHLSSLNADLVSLSLPPSSSQSSHCTRRRRRIETDESCNFLSLLAPAFGQLGSACLPEASVSLTVTHCASPDVSRLDRWSDYPYAAGFALISVFMIFIVELVATRAGASYLKKRSLKSLDPHSQGGNMRGHSMHGAHIDESVPDVDNKKGSGEESAEASLEAGENKIHATDDKIDEDGLSQLIGVAILEFAVMFQSVLPSFYSLE